FFFVVFFFLALLFFAAFFDFFAPVFFLAAALPPEEEAPSFGSARPSLIAPSTSNSLFIAALSDSMITLLSPATEAMKVSKKIASFALFIKSKTTAMSGGVAGFFAGLVADLVFGEYQSWMLVLPSAARVD